VPPEPISVSFRRVRLHFLSGDIRQHQRSALEAVFAGFVLMVMF
jgi:hypothetical protein